MVLPDSTDELLMLRPVGGLDEEMTAIHLVGCGLSLDRRARGQSGAAAANPHGLVQEFLNRSDPHLYQQALREVIGRCLYGVDIDPMAAELARGRTW